MIKKKLILSLSLLLLAGSISGCGKEEKKATTEASTETTTTIATEQTEVATEAVTEEEPSTEEITSKDEDEVVNEYMSAMVGTWYNEEKVVGDLYKKSTYIFNDDLTWSVHEEYSDGREKYYSGDFYCVARVNDYHDDYDLCTYPNIDKVVSCR